VYGGVLTEVEGKDVLIVADGDDRLQDKYTRSRDDSIARAKVCVFPKDTIILLMTTDDIR
jgi:hypothetical protein